MPFVNRAKIPRNAGVKFTPPNKIKKEEDYSDESDSYSDGDEEDRKDYRVGGYHPVEIGEVFIDRYKVLCKMGWGQYSTVWLTRDLVTDQLYALKIQKSATSYMEAAQDELMLFKEVMRRVNEEKKVNPNLVVNIVQLENNFLYSGVNGTHMCFVYERLGGSLLDLIKHYNYKGIPSAIVKPLAHDMLSGLAFLHKCRIIHTDLKPENVLLKSPLPSPPPVQKTMYDVISEKVNSNEEVKKLIEQCENKECSPEERKRLKTKLKKLKSRIRKNLSNNGIPTLWGFMKFNFDNDDASPSEFITEPPCIPKLTPCQWDYPDDCYYIKMYVLCPLRVMKEAFGPRHSYGDEDKEIYSEWTFQFECDDDDDTIVNMFQLRGHGRDKHTRLHDIRHIIMNNYTIQDKNDYILWSLRFDGRRIRTVFSILESRIPGFVVIHLPNSKYSLSAYEHSLIANASREFLPPATLIFRNVNGSLVGLYVPQIQEGIRLKPIQERLAMWPSDAMMSKEICNNRKIPPYFKENDVIGCKIVDLGNSCFINKQFTNDIQTRQYRCPETILHTPYSYSADIWSAACVIFELLTGSYLFQPKEHGPVSRDLEQLALFEEVVGLIPHDFAKTGKRYKEFYSHDGKLKYTKKYAVHKIAYRLNKSGVSLDESIVIEDLLLQMLQFQPDRRLTAAECLRHPWFTNTN